MGGRVCDVNAPGSGGAKQRAIIILTHLTDCPKLYLRTQFPLKFF